MSNCTNCGKQLEEGQVCDCSNATTTVAQTTSNSGFDFKECGKDCLNAVKGIFTKPVETIKKFVADSKFITGIVLIVIAALVKGLNVVLTLAHAFDKLKSPYYTPESPKYFDEFFETFAMSLVRYAAIAFVAYLVITIILKGKATWKETLSATGLSLIVVIFATILSTILIYFEGDLVAYIGSYIGTFASAFSMFVLFAAMKEKAGIDTNKLFVSLASVLVGAEIVVDIVNKLFD